MAKHAAPVVSGRYAKETRIGRLVRTVRTTLNHRNGAHTAHKCLDYSYLAFPANRLGWLEITQTIENYRKLDLLDSSVFFVAD